MEPFLNLVHGNTSLQVSSFFLVGGRLTRMVQVRIRVSRSHIHHPGRIVQVESQPDVFAFQLPLSDLFPHQLRRLQVERMLSHVGHPDRGDIDFWTEQISSYAFHVANAVVFRSCSSVSMLIELNISTERFSDFREVEPVIDEEFLLSTIEPVIDEDFLLSIIEPVGTQGGEFGAVPVYKSSIQALGKKRYRGDGKYGSTCAVCLEDFEAGDELTVMPCSHEFHQSCAAKWLERSSICPVCRYTVPTID